MKPLLMHSEGTYTKKPFIYSLIRRWAFCSSCKMETSEWKADRVRQMSFLFFSPCALQSPHHKERTLRWQLLINTVLAPELILSTPILQTFEMHSGRLHPRFSRVLLSTPLVWRGMWDDGRANTAKVLPASGRERGECQQGERWMKEGKKGCTMKWVWARDGAKEKMPAH